MKLLEYTVSLLCIILIAIALVQLRGDNKAHYNEGVRYLESGNTQEAINCFKKIPDYINYSNIRDLLEDEDIELCPSCSYILE